jgi:TetR/AcrR family transcriptional regulator
VPDDDVIMERGLAAFAERGFEGTSVRDLARALGVSHNFIHDRFGSKDGFWRAVVDHSLREMEHAVDAALLLPASDDLERLRRVVRHVGALEGPRPLLQQMLHFEAGQGSPRLLYIFERYIQPFTLKLTPVISGLVRDGVLRPVPWHILFFLLTLPGMPRGHLSLAELLGRPRHGDDDASADLLADLVIDALRVRPAPEREERATGARSP